MNDNRTLNEIAISFGLNEDSVDPKTQKAIKEFGGKPEDWRIHSNGGGCVYKDAKVDQSAYVESNVIVANKARVSGNTQVFGNAWVSGYAKVYGKSKILTGKIDQ